MADHSASYKTLLHQCAQGKATALHQIYDREAPRMLALGTSLLHRPADAEELVRESIGLIWRNADAYDPTLGSARAWIYSILRFRAQQRLKQSPTLSPFIKVKPYLLIPSDAPADLQQFSHLDERARKMIGLAYLHAYSYAEIAKECHSSIDLTQKHIHQALISLTRLFSGWKNHSDDELCVLGVYCLGLLRDNQSIAPAHALLSQNSSAAQDLLLWEKIFSALVYSLPEQTPPAQLIQRIYQDLDLPFASASTATPIHSATATPPAPSRFDTPITIQSTSKTSAEPVAKATAKTTPAAASVSPIQKPVKIEPTFSVTPQAETKSEPRNPTVTDPLESSTFTATKEKDAPTAASRSQPKHTIGNSALDSLAAKWKKSYWIGLAIAIALIAVLIWAFMPKAPTIQMVQMSPRAGAILQAPGQSSTPGWIVSIDPEGHVLFTPQVRTEIRPDQAVQLWTQGPTSTSMRSLGLINPNQPVTVPVEIMGETQNGQIFEMTLEPKQGSKEPTGSVLFIGRVVNFGEFQQALEQSSI